MIKKIVRKNGPVKSKKVVFNGITFASGLERYMYQLLLENDIDCEYEKHSFELIPSFNFENNSFERQSNSKGDFIDRGGKKVLGVKYTPDFVGYDFIIETKGRPNETFSIRWKLFKKWLIDNNDTRILYKPQTHNECLETVKLILKNRE